MNEIVKIEDGQLVSRFGDESTFQWLMQRQAEIYQVPWDDVVRYPDVRGALVKATQMAWTYGAMPGKHIYLLPFNVKDEKANTWRKTYAVADSYEWRKASADEKALEMHQQYMVHTEQMAPAEVQSYVTANRLGGPYDPTDRGFRARVLFRHEIDMCRDMGIEYNPPWHYGFWRKNADYKKDKWHPDNIPEGRTPDWVAMKRAEKSALAQHFELRPLRGWQQANDDRRRSLIEDAVTNALPEQNSDPRHRSMVISPPAEMDENGLLVQRSRTVDAETGEIMDNTTDPAPAPAAPTPTPTRAEHRPPPVPKAPAPKAAPATNGKSEAAGKFHKQVGATFGGLDVDAARHWFIGQWSEECTPDNVRFSTNDMADNELEAMTAELKKRVREVRVEYQRYVADLDAINVSELQEMAPEPV